MGIYFVKKRANFHTDRETKKLELDEDENFGLLCPADRMRPSGEKSDGYRKYRKNCNKIYFYR